MHLKDIEKLKKIIEPLVKRRVFFESDRQDLIQDIWQKKILKEDPNHLTTQIIRRITTNSITDYIRKTTGNRTENYLVKQLDIQNTTNLINQLHQHDRPNRWVRSYFSDPIENTKKKMVSKFKILQKQWSDKDDHFPFTSVPDQLIDIIVLNPKRNIVFEKAKSSRFMLEYIFTVDVLRRLQPLHKHIPIDSLHHTIDFDRFDPEESLVRKITIIELFEKEILKPKEKKILYLYTRGLTIEEIGNELQRSTTSIYKDLERVFSKTKEATK